MPEALLIDALGLIERSTHVPLQTLDALHLAATARGLEVAYFGVGLG